MPKAQTITVKARGLYDSGNNPWAIPDGALSEALNIDIGLDNIVRPRRGMSSIGTQYVSSFGLFQEQLVGFGSLGQIVVSADEGNNWGAYTGTYTGPVRFAESAKSLWFTTASGVYGIDSLVGTPGTAGVTPALDLSAAVAGAGTAVPNNTRVAYRAVFGRIDANGRTILGAPSSRVVLTNTAGTTQNVTVVITIPTPVQSSSYFVQLYRTGASVDQNTDPGDECYLVYEAALSAVSTVTITDSTPDGLGGASLYTNPSQETILNANNEPPLATDLAEFGGALWYSDVTMPAQRIINLLGVSGTNGLAINDTITVNGQVFTAKAAETVASREFLLATAGSVDQNVRDTVASLIKCINRTSAAAAYAIDLSDPAPAGIPGVIAIRRIDRTSNLTLAVSRSSAWANIKATTTPKRDKNGLVYSKQGQPDSVPVAIAQSPILVGSASEAIQRIVATRNALWVIKPDGVWRVTGTAGQFDVQPFDPTVRVISAGSVAALDNQVYLWTDQGVARVSESGVEIISRPIEGTLLDASVLSASSFAVAQEALHKYTLFVNGGDSGTYVFDTLTETWVSRDPVSTLGAGVTYSGKLVYSVSITGEFRRERSGIIEGPDGGMTEPIYVDAGEVTDIASVENPARPLPNVTIGVGYPMPVVGDLLWASDTKYGTVISVSGRIATLGALVGSFTSPGAATVYRSYAVTATYATKSPAPGASVEWQDAVLLFGRVAGYSATATLTGDSGTDSAITIDKNSNAGTARQIRVWPGRTSAFSGSMKVSYSERAAYRFKPTSLAGMVLTFSPQGDGVSR